MAKLTPFRAVRPVRDKVHLVATRPYYSYKKNVLKAKLEDNPFTFLHIINPEFGSKKTTEPNSPERFELVKQRYQEFIENGILIKDETPHLYIYRQTKNGHQFTGIVGGASVEEYQNDLIKKHEATLTSREQMFTDYLDIVGYNAEPVLLSHPFSQGIKDALTEYTSVRPEYEFTTTDRITHELWILDADQTAKIQDLFEEIDALYIADGHHRSASSAGLHTKRITNGYAEFPNEHSFLSFIINEEDLQILEFNRLIKKVNGKSPEQILKELTHSFEVEKMETPSCPTQEHQLTMYLMDNWYSLKCKEEIIDHSHPVKSLDAEILTQYILQPILGIQDLKTDDNIEFISGTFSLNKTKKVIDKNCYEAAFFLYPVTMEQVKRVADNQLIMPPKSTWVEPKLRSGLTIYNINE